MRSGQRVKRGTPVCYIAFGLVPARAKITRSESAFPRGRDLRFEIVLATRRLEPTLEFETVVEQGLSGVDDSRVLEHAKAHGLIVVSHDVNTMKAIAEKRISDGSGIAGLFLVPQSRSTRPIAESLLAVWAASEAKEWADRIVYLPL